jgi:hypothetical protein
MEINAMDSEDWRPSLCAIFWAQKQISNCNKCKLKLDLQGTATVPLPIMPRAPGRPLAAQAWTPVFHVVVSRGRLAAAVRPRRPPATVPPFWSALSTDVAAYRISVSLYRGRARAERVVAAHGYPKEIGIRSGPSTDGQTGSDWLPSARGAVGDWTIQRSRPRA